MCPAFIWAKRCIKTRQPGNLYRLQATEPELYHQLGLFSEIGVHLPLTRIFCTAASKPVTPDQQVRDQLKAAGLSNTPAWLSMIDRECRPQVRVPVCAASASF